MQPFFALPAGITARDVIAAHPWATLVSGPPGDLTVSHLPVLPEVEGTGVLGHLARADAEQHRLGTRDVVLVVQGPHGYVSPAFYRSGEPSVPTWNFVVAHLHGRPDLLDAEQTYDVLERTVDRFECERPRPFRLASQAAYAQRIAPHTTGFRLVPTRVEAKAKLSQDKSVADRAGVREGLERDGVHGNAELASWMRAVT